MYNFHYEAMPMMTSQILKSVDPQKPKNVNISRTKHFFLKYKNSLITQSGYFMTKNSFIAKVTFEQKSYRD